MKLDGNFTKGEMQNNGFKLSDAKLIDNSTSGENTQHFLSTDQTFALHCRNQEIENDLLVLIYELIYPHKNPMNEAGIFIFPISQIR